TASRSCRGWTAPVGSTPTCSTAFRGSAPPNGGRSFRWANWSWAGKSGPRRRREVQTMAKLFGAQRVVLQAIQDSPKDAAGFVMDAQVAQGTNIDIEDVQNWIETLEVGGYVDVARTKDGLIASITAQGRLQLHLYPPIPLPQDKAASSGIMGPVQTAAAE